MNCLNCQNEINDEINFCPVCGQKTKVVISVRKLISNFFGNVFNLDSKFFQTMPRLFIPGMLTIHYIAGKRQKYFTPGRLFFISMLFFIALFKITFIQSDRLKLAESNISKQSILNSLSDDYDSIVDSHNENIQDSIFISRLKEDLLLSKMNVEFNENINTKINESGGNNVAQEEVIPGVKFSINLPEANVDSTEVDSLDSNQVSPTINDFLVSTPEEFAEQIGRKDPFTLFLISQFQKLFKDLGNSINFIIGNMIWAIFFLVFIIALFLKFLYIREGRFYVEHVVFQMHYISSVLWFFNLLFILVWLNVIQHPSADPTVFALTIFFEFGFLYFAMKRYYQQGLLKTMIKYFIILFGYFFVSIVCLIITAGISVLFI